MPCGFLRVGFGLSTGMLSMVSLSILLSCRLAPSADGKSDGEVKTWCMPSTLARPRAGPSRSRSRSGLQGSSWPGRLGSMASAASCAERGQVPGCRRLTGAESGTIALPLVSIRTNRGALGNTACQARGSTGFRAAPRRGGPLPWRSRAAADLWRASGTAGSVVGTVPTAAPACTSRTASSPRRAASRAGGAASRRRTSSPP